MASFFPHLTSTGPAPTAKEIYTTYRQAFEQQISEGTRRTLVFPYNFLSLFLVAIYLCIPHKKNPIIYAARWPLVALITWFELRLIREASGTGVGLGYPVGMLSSLIIMISWTWLILKKPQWEAQRVQRVKILSAKDAKKIPSTEKSIVNDKLCQQELGNDPISISRKDFGEVGTEMTESWEYYWQPYPESLKERIPWVLDLVVNSRGPGWNWAISTIPPVTPEVLSKLENSEPENIYSKDSLSESRRHKPRFEHLLSLLSTLIQSYLVADIMRTIMMKDPYFKFGPTTYAIPSYLQLLHPVILRLYRTLFSAIILIAGIKLSSAQMQIVASYIVGPRVLGLRGEHWYYPVVWGNFSSILERGLSGVWGSYWHQTFRTFFTAPTKYLMQRGYIKPGTYVAKVAGSLSAFGLSGFMHGAASATTFPYSRPSDEVIFFVLQGLGIALEDFIHKALSPVTRKLPVSIRHAGNLFFALTWLCLTGIIISDNLARGGFWIVEQVPFSLMQALGFGEHDSGWNCWSMIGPKWQTGKNWWESGVNLMQ